MKMIHSIEEIDEQERMQVRACPNTLNDLVFKYAFGRVESKPSLIALLNAFLHDELEHDIKDLSYINNEALPSFEDRKKVCFDISCRLDNGATVDVEVQVADNNDFANRITFYLARVLNGSLKSGQKYSSLKPAITLTILDFNLFDHPEPFSSWGICNLKTHERLTKLVSLNFVELRKFEKPEKFTKIDRWMMILSRLFSLTEKRAVAKGDVAMEQVLRDVDNFLTNPDNYIAYINQERAVIDELSRDEYLLSKGEKRGFERGEKQRSYIIALDMLHDGMPIDTIVRYSRLALPEVKKIAKENGIAIN